MAEKMVNRYKKHSLLLGFIFTVVSALFSFVMTWLIYSDMQILERISDNLYDCGVDAMGTFVCAALYYGSMKQEGNGAKAFRTLIVLVCASFVLNFLMYSTRLPEYNVLTFLFILLIKLIDLGLIYYFYQYIRITLGFEGKLAEWVEKAVPILLILESLVILSNIFFPTTFYVDRNGVYYVSGAFITEDIYLIVISVITTILIIRSESPHNQKVAALTFIFLPLTIYLTTIEEFGNASQYGMILISLVIMYCIIFNYYSGKLAATQAELNMATEIQASMLPSIWNWCGRDLKQGQRSPSCSE